MGEVRLATIYQAVAAVHAGLLKANETKLIKVKVMTARDSYPSIVRNGITSEQYDSSEGSYQLMAPSPEDVADAPEIQESGNVMPKELTDIAVNLWENEETREQRKKQRAPQ